jgi:NAD-dependent deacetylase
MVPIELVQRLKSATRVVALTGAGISAESGVPTFRDSQTGLWKDFKPEDLATPDAFRANPKRVWDWYAWRRQRVDRVQPNPGHRALVALETLVPHFVLVTQNVDGLHQRAGSRDVVELHGNITRVKCSVENRVITGWESQAATPPCCPDCGALLRPDVVWFGEMLPEQAMARALSESERCDVLLSIGTSSVVYPAAMLPHAALEQGATIAEINPDPSPLAERADFALAGAAGRILPALVEQLKDALDQEK